MMTTTSTRFSLETMDRDVRAETAFLSATDLLAACQNGYTPTLTISREDSDQRANAVLRIREWLGDNNCGVFPVRL